MTVGRRVVWIVLPGFVRESKLQVVFVAFHEQSVLVSLPETLGYIQVGIVFSFREVDKHAQLQGSRHLRPLSGTAAENNVTAEILCGREFAVCFLQILKDTQAYILLRVINGCKQAFFSLQNLAVRDISHFQRVVEKHIGFQQGRQSFVGRLVALRSQLCHVLVVLQVGIVAETGAPEIIVLAVYGFLAPSQVFGDEHMGNECLSRTRRCQYPMNSACRQQGGVYVGGSVRIGIDVFKIGTSCQQGANNACSYGFDMFHTDRLFCI